MKEIAEILREAYGYCSMNALDHIEALIEQEQKPMVEALKLARPYVKASAKAMKHTIVTKPAEDLAKIDAVLEGK